MILVLFFFQFQKLLQDRVFINPIYRFDNKDVRLELESPENTSRSTKDMSSTIWPIFSVMLGSFPGSVTTTSTGTMTRNTYVWVAHL